MDEITRANVLGVGISVVSMADAVFHSNALLDNGDRGYICVTGVHGVMEAQEDETFRDILNSSFLTIPDGMPTVWVGQLQGFKGMTRVYGPDFMLEMCKASVERGYKHFLYGGKPGIADDLRNELLKRFPGLQITGTFTPPFRQLTSAEQVDLATLLADSEADILWCGLSTPKQERFMAQYFNTLPAKLMVGVGAAFDINSGHLKDAPAWMKQAGLQWLFRMVMEPRRLASRYLRNNPRFMWLILLQVLGLRNQQLS